AVVGSQWSVKSLSLVFLFTDHRLLTAGHLIFMSITAESLSLERKIKMHEAREAIIDRLAHELPASIDLDRFLRAVVKELGRMMNADRCALIQLASDSELRISHEWRASEDVPSSEGTTIP